MLRRWWTFAALLALLWLQGCAATGPKGSELGATLGAVPAGYARLVLFRSSGMLGAAVQPEILVDGQVVGTSKPGGFFVADVGPGKRVISASTEAASRLELDVLAGRTYYVRSAISMGLMVGRIALTEEGAVTAREELADLAYTGTSPVRIGAPAAGAVAAAAAVPAAQTGPAAGPPAAVAGAAALKTGDQIVYRLTDQLTGLSREVLLAVDWADAGRVQFNQGGRVEAPDGSLISLQTPAVGDMDACAPPGGWVKPGQGLGAAWSGQYSKAEGSPCGGDFSFRSRVVSEDVTATALGPLLLQRVDTSARVQRTGRYTTFHEVRARAWWSPELRRIVRFESEVVPFSVGVTPSKESVELLAIRRP